MAGTSVEYVALQYSPDVRSSDGHPIAVVFRYFDAGAERFRVQQETNWRSTVPSVDWEYIEDVLSEFSDSHGTLAEGDFRRISEMSSGVLRTATTGMCTEEDMNRLLG